jgi:hypothetical protein
MVAISITGSVRKSSSGSEECGCSGPVSVRANGFRKERSCPLEIERGFEEERKWEIGRIFIRNG